MIDFHFIKKLEGSTCQGYVPDPDNRQSGVTIACGFDIGQRSAGEINRAFYRSLADKLIPYAGLKKQVAVQALAQSPLMVTCEEAADIHQYCLDQAMQRLEQQWDGSNADVTFNQLPCACQTIIASVAFQYGNLSIRTPNFWLQVTSGDWKGALKNLRNFGDKYPSRRNKEAELLEQWLVS